MALQKQVVDVPIQPMNQALPATAGPVGRLKTLINGTARRWQRGQDGQTLRIEKRRGFQQFATAVRDPGTGAVSSKVLDKPTMLTTLGERLIAGAASSLFVLSEAASCFESPTYYCPTQALRAAPIYTTSTVAIKPDSARIGSRTFYTWSEPVAAAPVSNGMILDDDGTVIRTPFIIEGGVGITSCKAMADGTQFWAVFFDGVGISVDAFDANGTVLGSASIAAVSTYFDVARNTRTANSIVVFTKNGAAGFQSTTFTWNGATVVTATVVTAAVFCDTGRLGLMKNDRGDNRYYLVTISGAGPYDYKLSPISDATLTITAGPFTIAAAQAVAPVEITGKMAPSGNADAVVALSFLDPTPVPQKNYTDIYTVSSVGVSVLAVEAKSLTVASRPFVLPDGSYSLVMYYQSDQTITPGLVQQSTFFLLNLAAPWQVCGRFDYGLAYADWQTTGSSTDWLHVATPTVDPSGAVRVPLGYRASSFTTRVKPTTGSPGAADTTLYADIKANTAGIKLWTLGPDVGAAVSYGDELLVPGPQATAFEGASFSSHGVALAPEISGIAHNNAGGGLTAGATYEYVAVAEWTDNTGNRVRSQQGSPVSTTLGGADNRAVITGYMDHATVKLNLTFALYRTVTIGGIQSTAHYKVTNDLAPVFNDPTAATWTFTDTMSDAVAAANEILYTDKGYLDRYPCPPFTAGCAAANRVFVVGYDNAIWFSGEKTEGDALWFTPLFRIPVPTTERITAIKPLDNFLVIFCDGSSVFSIPTQGLPAPNGAGAFPTPTLLPFSNGCTGPAVVTSDGIMYASTQGGVWLVTRGLQNQYIGEPVKDATELGGPVIDMTSDEHQRVYCMTQGGALLVYDQVISQWYIWAPFATPRFLTSHKGQLAYMTTSSPGVPATVWRQSIGGYADVDAAFALHAINRTISIAPIHMGGVRSYKRVWRAQFEGEYLAPHTLTVVATYYADDRDTPATDTYSFTPDGTKPYVYELPPTVEQCSSLAYVFTEGLFSDGGGPVFDAGFALEAMAFEVGVEKGLAKVPAGRRIQST